MLTNNGLTELLERGTANFDYAAVGSGETAPAVTDTALETELEAVQLSTGEVAGNTWTGEAFFVRTAAVGSWAEVGIRNQLAASGQTLYIHALFSTAQTKTALKEGIVSVTVELANAA